MSAGPFLSAARQRVASTSSAVESGPPETARTRARAERRSSNSVFASAAETGAASSAADTLLFPVDALLHADRRAGIFARDLAERGAGRLLLAHGGERLAEAEQRVRRARRGLVFGRNVEVRFRGVAVALALKQALAQPVLRVGGEPVARIAAQEGAEAVFGERVVAAQDIAIGEVVGVLRAVGRRQRRNLAAGPARMARRPRVRRERRPDRRDRTPATARRCPAASPSSAARRARSD